MKIIKFQLNGLSNYRGATTEKALHDSINNMGFLPWPITSPGYISFATFVDWSWFFCAFVVPVLGSLYLIIFTTTSKALIITISDVYTDQKVFFQWSCKKKEYNRPSHILHEWVDEGIKAEEAESNKLAEWIYSSRFTKSLFRK